MFEELTIRRGSGKALYLQIYEHLSTRIATRQLSPATQLPTEKHLAQQLRVSRNTVSMAYARLERERRIESIPGRGTFVTGEDGGTTVEGHKVRLERLLDLALEEAFGSGFSLEEYAKVVDAQLRRHRRRLRQTRIWFIECNQEQLAAFAADIRSELDVETRPLLLDALQAHPEEVARTIAATDVVVTSVYHGPEVMRLLPRHRVHIVALEPRLDTLIQVAHIPSSARVGLVCRSDRFAQDAAATLREAKIDLPGLNVIRTADAAELKQALKDLSVAIVSPGRRQEVEQAAPAGLSVIEFVYRPHTGSLNLIRTLLVEKQKG
ncbi:MAG: winged helix-turn-helix transcriptional regulator [Kiritimatiellae bacterium]|nr:winged helix-turn-helix transcriptional regulator [Kiritimatiellia bacterium]